MSAAAQVDGLPEPDLIDRIANWFPADVRADYYREMRHCRSLPANDEMLRILRAMQFLTLLMVQVPERVGTEREKLEQLFADGLRTLQNTIESSKAYQEQLDQRLEQLPENIATRISPEAIAREINESLRQQFVKSTIPETGRALVVVATEMKNASREFGNTAADLGHRYSGAVAQAVRAIQEIERTSSHAVTTTSHAAKELLDLFHQEYRWAICVVSTLTLVLGFGFGLMFQRWLDRPADLVDHAPTVQSAPPVKQKTKP